MINKFSNTDYITWCNELIAELEYTKIDYFNKDCKIYAIAKKLKENIEEKNNFIVSIFYPSTEGIFYKKGFIGISLPESKMIAEIKHKDIWYTIYDYIEEIDKKLKYVFHDNMLLINSKKDITIRFRYRNYSNITTSKVIKDFMKDLENGI